MYSRQVKAGIFALAGLNSVATTYYFYYVYFFMQARFGFGRMENLILAAALGFIYTFASIFCGRFAQKRGYFTAGAMLEKLGLRSMFLVPSTMRLAQLALAVRLERLAAASGPPCAPENDARTGRLEMNPRPIGQTRAFLKMAWLANPFA